MSGMKNKYVIKMIENTTKQNKVQQDKSTNSKKVLARELVLNLSEEKKTESLTVSRDLLYFKSLFILSTHFAPLYLLNSSSIHKMSRGGRHHLFTRMTAGGTVRC